MKNMKHLKHGKRQPLMQLGAALALAATMMASGALADTFEADTFNTAPMTPPVIETAAPRGGTQSFGGHYPEVTAYTKVDGPRQSKAYIREYFAEHPEVEEKAAEFIHVLRDIKTFDERWKGHADGTFKIGADEWYPVGEPKGFCVSFQQNDSLEDRYAAYDDETYAALCAIAMNELGVDSVNIGWFSGAEISFCCDSFEKAMKFAVEHNQHSIYDTAADTGVENIFYNPETNPIFE